MTQIMQDIQNATIKQGMNQRRFANKTGISEQSISRWFGGMRSPKISDVEIMANALGMEIRLCKKEEEHERS